MEADRFPVVVGVGQLTQKDVAIEESLDPLAMLTRVATLAAEDAGVGRTGLEAIDAISLVDCAGWHPDNGPDLLSQALGAQAKTHITAPIGGETGLTLLNDAARRIARGDSRVAFVGGANLLKTLLAAIKRKVRLDWPKASRGKARMLSEPRTAETEIEKRHGLVQPIQFYPMHENALRARRGESLTDHRARLGALFSPFTRVAAENPHAWFPIARSPEELITVTAHNRMIAYPYTKYLNAVLETDQAAGVLLMSAEAARALGVARQRCVYWRGGAYAEERSWFVTEREDLSRSVALEACAARALAAGGVAIADVNAIDFYSCFPVAVELACEAYGVAEDDPRGFTVTGGLPFAGGPASNYTTHAVAAMVEHLRRQPGGIGLTTGNGWYLTKHSASVFGTEPPTAGELVSPVADAPKAVGSEPVAVAERPEGQGTVEAYTITYARDGAPERGIVVGRLSSGQRFVANTPDDRTLLESLASQELCGTRGSVASSGERSCFTPE